MKLIILYALALVACQSIKQKPVDSCKTEFIAKLDIKHLHTQLIGDWDYAYSFIDDTCFSISDLGDLPSLLKFHQSDRHLLEEKFPRLVEFGTGKTLFGLRCEHEQTARFPYTYPIVNRIAKDSSNAKITHYAPENGTGNTYSYFLEYLHSKKLVIRNERYYQIGEKRRAGVQHVFIKKAP